MGFSWKVTQCLLFYLCIHECHLTQKDTHKYEERYQGRYSGDLDEHELTVPTRVHPDGSFRSYHLTQYYDHEPHRRGRRKRSADDHEVHVALPWRGAVHHVTLRPSAAHFMSPALVVERRRGANASSSILRPARDRQCHYTGHVRGIPGSRAAISLCDGMAGHVRTPDEHLLVEPAQGASARSRDGRHVHLVVRRPPTHLHQQPTCGTSDDWRSAWRERLLWQQQQEPWSLQLGTRNASTRSVSKERYLETLVVADKKFIQHHQGNDMEKYVLTIMNMVSDYYHDESVGNLLHVVVVRILFLEKEEEELDLEISQNAEDTLDSFCKWQEGVNPPDTSHPSHHDIAVLLTRYDLCSDNMSNCNLLGLAFVAQACNPNKSCAINEDSGLLLSVVVTHEMGHVMGCSHDEVDISGCPPKIDDSSYNVMSPYVVIATTQWSNCSRNFITGFLDNGLGECLLDEPAESHYKLPGMLPGVVYDLNQQCKMMFNSPEPCSVLPETQCKELVCKEKDSCVSDGSPPADGSKCGENKWCYEQQCVPVGDRPQAVSGGWGEWSAWGHCSRTCGGGVQYQQRECDNPRPLHRGKYCVGQRRRYRICNFTPCDESGPTFLEEQCTEMNKKPFMGELHTWKPYRAPDKDLKPCELVCINEKHTYSTLAPRVADGTPCKPGTNDLCINGVCRHVGCDWVLDSGVTEDVCGICGGNGTLCTKVEGTFNEIGHGYVRVTTIPVDSVSLTVEELKPSENTLALALDGDPGPQAFLNGNFTEEADGEFKAAGAIFVYSHPEKNMEQIEAKGPIRQPITLYVSFFENANPGVTYRYYHRQNHPAPTTPKYSWEYIGWEECSVLCGGGTQEADPVCVEESVGRVTDQFCSKQDKPTRQSRVCNEQECKARWHAGKWGRCSGCIFRKGVQRRQVRCVREAQHVGEDAPTLPAEKCQGLDKPSAMKLCSSKQPCKQAAPKGHHQRRSQQDYEEVAEDGESEQGAHTRHPQVVQDHVPPGQMLLLEMPARRTDMDLSDEAQREVGDQLARDELDVGHGWFLTGQRALDERLRLQQLGEQLQQRPPPELEEGEDPSQ